MISNVFGYLRKVFTRDEESPVRSTDRQTRARVKGALLASALAQPAMKKSSRQRAGKMRTFSSYRSK